MVKVLNRKKSIHNPCVIIIGYLCLQLIKKLLNKTPPILCNKILDTWWK